MAASVPSAILLYFSTQVLGIAPASAGMILVVTKGTGLLVDPLCGRIFDSFSGRPGIQGGLLAMGGLIMAAGLSFVFAPPDLASVRAREVWLGIGYLIFSLGYSLMSVSHVAGTALIDRTHRERERLAGWRMTAVLAGVFAGAAGAPLLVAAYGGDRSGYAAMAHWAAAVSLTLTVPSAAMLARRSIVPSLPTARRPAMTVRIPEFRPLALAYSVLMISVGAYTAAIPFWLIDRNGGDESDVASFLGILLGVSIVCAPVWTRLIRRTGEEFALRLVLCGYVFASLALLGALLANAGWMGMMAVAVLLGAAFSGLQVVPFTMLARLAARASGAMGNAVEGTLSGAWTALEKLGLALGPAITALLLALFDGVPGRLFDLGICAVLLGAAIGGLWSRRRLINRMP